MSLEEFEQRRISDRDKATIRVRSISNYVMGILLLGAGAFFLIPTKATAPYVNQYDSTTITLFGIVCIIYGVFRIYRGYKKNYFRES